MSRAMTAATRPALGVAGATAIADGLMPREPDAIIAGLQRSLFRALVHRGDTWHLRTCLAAGVNSRPYACSEPCIRVQVTLLWAERWRERHERPAEQQAGLWESAG